MKVFFRTQQVGQVSVFYREAGRGDAPVLLLLHGFPTSSHMFRSLMPILAPQFRVIAPDLPGFGKTQAPGRLEFEYTFKNLADSLVGFTQAIKLSRYALYVFDHGAPVGYRMALAHPERISAIICQNGNAYAEALSDMWAPWEVYWREDTAEAREACRKLLSPKAIWEGLYLHGADPALVAPDGYMLDMAYMTHPEAEEIQLDLIRDYGSNIAMYPVFQEYFRKHQPPFLAVWGRNDPVLLRTCALAYRRDLPQAEVHLLENGHCALETHAAEIADYVLEFLPRKVQP